jgi:hypothetical protein
MNNTVTDISVTEVASSFILAIVATKFQLPVCSHGLLDRRI